MRTLVTAVAMLLMLSINVKADDSINIITDSSAITIVSDTLSEDTSNYTITTTIPKSFVKSANYTLDNIGDLSAFAGEMFSTLPAMLGIGGGIIIIMLFITLILPLLLLILVIWLLVRNSRRAKKADTAQNIQAAAATVADNVSEVPNPEDGTTAQIPNGKKPHSYTNRRDNAIRNIAIGIGLFAMFACIGFRLGEGIGILVACWGIGEFIIARNNRNDEQQ